MAQRQDQRVHHMYRIAWMMLMTLCVWTLTPVSAENASGTTRLLSGHTGEIQAVAFSPDSTFLASGSADQTIRLWDPRTGQELKRLQGHTGTIRTLVFSPNSQQLVSGSSDSTIRVWDLAQGKEHVTLRSPFGAVRGLAFAPKGSSLASVGDDGSLRLWDWASSKEIRAMKSRFGTLFAVAFAPEGLTLATGGSDALVHIWDTATFGKRSTFTGHTGVVYTLTFAPSGTLLASGAADGVVRLWDLTIGRERSALTGHTGAVHAVAFTPDGSTLAAVGAAGTTRLWDAATGQARPFPTEPGGPLFTVAFSPNGAFMASGGQDRVVRLTTLREDLAVASGTSGVPPATVVATTKQAKPTPPAQPQVPAPSAVTPRVETRVAPPVIALASPTDGQQITGDRVQVLGAAASDTGVARMELRVNGQPIARDTRGLAQTKNLEFSERVMLQEGKNTIDVTVFDADQVSATRTVTVTRVVERGTIWAAVVGISQYKTVTPLQYADQDALAFYDYLIQTVGVPKDNVTLLTNQQATLVNVRRTLGTDLKRKAGPHDTVIIYFAGHGAPEADANSPDDDGLEKYLVFYDADPDDLYTTGMPMREVEVILQRLSAERVIFITDACFSGATTGRTFTTGSRRAVLSEAFLTRLSKAKGRVVLTASRANEVSAERTDLRHGVFTYYLLEGLRGKADVDSDGIITVDEAYNYVSRTVPMATGQNQHPVKKGEVEGQLALGRVR